MQRLVFTTMILFALTCSRNSSEKKSTSRFDDAIKPHAELSVLVDTTKIVPIALLDSNRNQMAICRLLWREWEGPVYWSQVLVDSGDTLGQFLKSFDWRDFGGLDDTSEVVNRDSVLYHIKAWFFEHMHLPKRYMIPVNDERREGFKEVSRFCFGESYRPLGYSETTIDNIHASFWLRYEDKPITCIQQPLGPLPEGDEALYVYDAGARRIVEFYRP